MMLETVPCLVALAQLQFSQVDYHLNHKEREEEKREREDGGEESKAKKGLHRLQNECLYQSVQKMC